MKFFLVVIMCIGIDCKTAWQEQPYSTRYECELNASELVSDLSTTFPDSDGEVYCLTKVEYEDWKNQIENGLTPKLKNRPAIYQDQSV